MEKKEAERGASENENEKQQQEEEQVVNPWEVSAKEGGKIDYDKLIEKFGCQRLNQTLVDRIERLTSRRAHVFLRRGVFFAHRYRPIPTPSRSMQISGFVEGIIGM